MDRQTRRLVRDYGGTIFVAVLVALLIRFFVLEAYRIPSAAMKPTLEPGDTIFVAKWPFGLRFPWSQDPITQARMPERGEVVVFTIQTDARRDYIKRVIGVPGDSVAIRGGRVTLNGAPLAELTRDPCGKEKLPGGKVYDVCWEKPFLDDYGPETVPAGSVFLLGDFRSTATADTARSDRVDPTRLPRTKSWGIFPASSIKGKALWLWLSVEPRAQGWFPQFRFDRMLRKVE